MSSEVFECTLDILPDEAIGRDKKLGDLVFTDSLGRSTTADLENDPLTELTIKRLSYWVGNSSFQNEDLRLLGHYLFNLLFHSEIRKELERSYYDVFRDREQNADFRKWSRFRLVLKFHPRAKTDLVSYPWEFLFMPKRGSQDEGVFLACEHTELILTRFVPPRTPGSDTLQKVGRDEKLCILLAYCQPSDLPTIDGDPIDGNEVIAKIKTHIKSAENIRIEDVMNPTFDELQEAIKLHKPHIFHFVGHGKDGGIYVMMTAQEIKEHHDLFSEQKESKWIGPKTVGALFVAPKPQLVFLESCEGAKSRAGSMSNAALELIDSGISAVVAMQFEIQNGEALRFSSKFYSLISAGIPIDEAVAEGRRVLATNPEHRDDALGWNDRRFGTPVLYLQTKNAIIVEAKPHDCCPQCSDAVDPAKSFCPNCGCRIGACGKCKALISLAKGECKSCGHRLDSQGAVAEVGAGSAPSVAPADARVGLQSPAPTSTVNRSVNLRPTVLEP
ncbi:MAG TPA: CHAT domain-containing protein [Blastocatellia bacterium]|jgi:hypothetical protein|nr:CHAT domain-containing protein [Blastocatellia bacterium]